VNLAIQPALLKGPGTFAAAQVWRARGRRIAPLFERAAGIVDERRAETLIAARDEAAPAIFPREGAGGRVPSTQADLFVQLGGETREALLAVAREVAMRLGGVAELDEEVVGARIGDGREPFGYRDGLRAPTEEEVRRDAVVAGGPLAGCTLVAWVRFEQDLAKFAALSAARRDRVMGRTPDGTAIGDAPAEAHVVHARRWGRFVRRGFPYRWAGREGLAFIAAAGAREELVRAFDAFVGGGANEGGADALTRYVSAVSGGLYVAPSEGGWLRDAAERARRWVE
jgi:putative iron-dependent peroxidase